MEHPVKVLLRNGLPEIDFSVTRHGFVEGGRDYVFVLEDASGRHAEAFELTLIDVEGLTCAALLGAAPLSRDLAEDAVAFEGVLAEAGETSAAGWSFAYPGVAIPAEAGPAWRRLGRPLHAVAIQTDRVMISMVFSEARLRPLTPGTVEVTEVFIPLPPGSP